MTRLAADSTVAEYLPANLPVYLGYIDGRYQSYEQIKARFPHALVIPIATQPGGDVGIVGDGPPDNGTWPEWVAWVSRRRRAGVDPTMNTTLSNWTAGVSAFNAAGVAQPHWWISSWDGHATMIDGAVGHQYVSYPNRYDLSVLADYWPGVDPAPSTKPPATGGGGTTPTPPAGGGGTTTARVKDMLLIEAPDPSGHGTAVYLLSGPLLVHVTDGASMTAFKQAGVPTAVISKAMYDGIVAGITALETLHTAAVTAVAPSKA